MLPKLSIEKVKEEIAGLKGWEVRGDFLVKEFKFRQFMGGIKFVNHIAKIAEELGHHPDIHIRWTTVRLEVQSHDEGGITERDIRLVREIEKSLSKKKGKVA